MNNFTISTFDDFQDTVENEPVSIEFGMDPVNAIRKFFFIMSLHNSTVTKY